MSETNSRVPITRISIRNFKKLTECTLEPTGEITVFAGDSGQGKTSVLQAVRAALTGADPEVITQGEDQATVFLEFGDGSTIERVIRSTGEDGLMVSQEGRHLDKAQAKAFLKALAGQGVFDPVRWVQLGGGDKAGRTERRREQRDQLLRAIPMSLSIDEVAEAIEELGEDATEAFRLIDMPEQLFSLNAPHGLVVCEELRRIAYEVRTMVNRDRDAAEEDLKRSPAPKPPVPEESIEEIRELEVQVETSYQQALGAIRARQSTVSRADALKSKIAQAEADRDGMKRQDLTPINQAIKLNDTHIRNLEGQIEALKRELSAAEEKQSELKRKLLDLQRINEQADLLQRTLESDKAELAGIQLSLGEELQDPQSLKATLEEIRALRAKREAQDAHEEAAKTWQRKAHESEALTRIVELFRDGLPKRVLERANLPLPGLGIDGETLTIDGIPLHQKGTSEQIRLGVMIASILNPGAGFICVDGLESMGQTDRQALYAACREFGVQILATEVDPDATPGDGRVVIRNGEVIAA